MSKDIYHFGCAGDNRTSAHKDERTLCLPNHFQGFFDILIFDSIRYALGLFRLLIFIVALIRGGILGDVHHDRTGTSASGDIEGLAKSRGQCFCILNNKVMLGNRHGNTGDIHLLEGISSQK